MTTLLLIEDEEDGARMIAKGLRQECGWPTIAVDAASGDTGGGSRDRRMKRDILEVQRYLDARFTPTAIEGLSADAPVSEAKVSGCIESLTHSWV